MMERLLLTPDELKSMPRGQFVVMKTGSHPMKVRLKLFFQWGIEFEKDNPYTVKGQRRPQGCICRKERNGRRHNENVSSKGICRDTNGGGHENIRRSIAGESESPMQTQMKPNERQGVKPVPPSRRQIQNMQEVKQDE